MKHRQSAIMKRGSLFNGFFNTFRAVPFAFRNSGVIPYFAVPFILNIAVLSAIFYFSYSSLVPSAEGFLSGAQWYMRFIRAMVSPVLFLLLSLFTMFIYSIAGSIITSPFLDLLSAKTEKIFKGEPMTEKFSAAEMISDILRAVGNTLRLIGLIVVVNIFLLLLNLVPGGSFIYAFINFFAAMFFYGFQFYDFPLERRRLKFSQKLGITWRNKSAVAGTGLSFFLVSFIPVIGFLGLNLCTMGAAITYIEDIEKE